MSEPDVFNEGWKWERTPRSLSEVDIRGFSMPRVDAVHGNENTSRVDELVKQNMPLVNQIARRYSRFRPDLHEDLVQVGAIGLLKAIQYHDPNRQRSASFKTLASCYIKGEIRHFLRDHSSLVRVPRKYSEINSLLTALQETLTKELQHTPTVNELAERSGFSVQQICDAMQSFEACTHYESFESSDEHAEGEDMGPCRRWCRISIFKTFNWL